MLALEMAFRTSAQDCSHVIVVGLGIRVVSVGRMSLMVVSEAMPLGPRAYPRHNVLELWFWAIKAD